LGQPLDLAGLIGNLLCELPVLIVGAHRRIVSVHAWVASPRIRRPCRAAAGAPRNRRH
jgi:hypothetical protein